MSEFRSISDLEKSDHPQAVKLLILRIEGVGTGRALPVG